MPPIIVVKKDRPAYLPQDFWERPSPLKKYGYKAHGEKGTDSIFDTIKQKLDDLDVSTGLRSETMKNPFERLPGWVKSHDSEWPDDDEDGDKKPLRGGGKGKVKPAPTTITGGAGKPKVPPRPTVIAAPDRSGTAPDRGSGRRETRARGAPRSR